MQVKTLMVTNSLNEQALADLERFCAAVKASSVVVGDLQAGNIVYAYDQTQGAHFALIDGLGDKTFVPLLRMSKFLNRRAKERKLARLMAAVRRATAPQVVTMPQPHRFPTLRGIFAGAGPHG